MTSLRQLSFLLILLPLLPETRAQWLPFFSPNGATANANFGASLAGLGDYNNDGFMDLAVGAPGEGKVYVYGGPNGTLIATLTGSAADEFGAAIEFAELDGTAGDELVVGSPAASGALGKIESFDFPLLTATSSSTGTDIGGRLGSAFSAFDSNSDGTDEVAVGAPNADKAKLLRLVGGSWLTVCSFTGTPGSTLGHALAGDADFNNDGFSDLVIGAPSLGAGGPGAFIVYNLVTCSQICSLTGFNNGDALGFSVATIGNLVSSAPAPNVLAGSPRRDFGFQQNVGSLRIANRNCLSACEITGAAAGDQFGFSCTAAGDVDLDGNQEFVIGAPFADLNGTDSGTATLFSGGSICSSNLCQNNGANAGDQYGFMVEFLGDFNNDGRLDVAISAPGADPNGSNSGLVEVVSLPASNFTLTGSAPLGPGSLQLDLQNGPSSVPYFLAVTLNNVGTAPNGWFLGIDITIVELQAELQAGFPFLGILSGAGGATIGPLLGLPSGFAFDSVGLALSFGFSLLDFTPAITVTVL